MRMQRQNTNRWIGVCLVYAVMGGAHLTSAAEGLTFQPIFFESKNATLTRSSEEALKRVLELLKANPLTELELQGHAGMEGEGIDAIALSRDRAEAARKHLEKLGVNPSRLRVEGKGSSQLQNVNNPSARENQRVEFVFSAGEKTAEGKDNLEEIEVVYWNTLYHCLYQIGADQGYFEQEGFKIELVATNHSYSDQVRHACGLEPFLEKGSAVFTGAVCGGSPHEAIAKGVPLVVIGGMLAGGSMLIAKPTLAAKLRADPKNFNGITIGRPRGTILTSMVVSWFLSKKGVDAKKSVKWKIFNSHEEIVEAVASGAVDAGDTYAPLHLTAMKKHGLAVVYNTVELFPYHPCCRVITTQTKLKAHREKYVRFMKAVIKSHEFFIKQPAKAIDIVAKYTGYPVQEVRDSLTNPNFILDPDPLKNGFVKFWNMMNETGFIKSNRDITKYIDTSIYEEALNALMKEGPKNPYYVYMMKKFKEQDT